MTRLRQFRFVGGSGDRATLVERVANRPASRPMCASLNAHGLPCKQKAQPGRSRCKAHSPRALIGLYDLTWCRGYGSASTVDRLQDLTPDHRANVLRFMRRNADAKQHAEADALRACARRVANSQISAVLDAEAEAVLRLEPIEWFESTPFGRHLTYLCWLDSIREGRNS